MRQIINVATREIVERKLIFVGGLLIGLLTLATPLLPDTKGDTARNVIDTSALILGIAFAFSLSATMGTTVIARDLAERRMGFYFARPLSPWSIWGGKIVGAFLIVVGSAVLVLLPSTLIGGGLITLFREIDNVRLPRGILSMPGPFFIFAAALLFAMALGHLASVALRSKSPWVALDVFGLLTVVLILWLAIRPLIAAGAVRLVDAAIVFFVFLFMIAALVAGAVGVARGRVDIRVVHRAGSIVLMSTLLLAALGIAAYSVWVRAAEPDDLSGAEVRSIAGSGNWFVVSGFSKGRFDYAGTFLMNAETRKWIRIPAQEWFTGNSFSKDGTKAVWGELTSQSPLRMSLFFADLSTPEPSVKRMLVSVNPRQTNGPVLSADGSRMALVEDGLLSVYDTAERRSIASLKWPEEKAGFSYLSFAGSDTLRIHSSANDKTSVYELEIPTRRLARLATVDAQWALPNEEGDRMIGRRAGAGERVLLDGRTGALLAELGEAMQSRWLSDGRVAALRRDGNSARLDVYSRDGAVAQSVTIPSAPEARLASEVAPGKVVVAAVQKSVDTSAVYLVDLASGTARKVAEGLVPDYWWRGNLYSGAGGSLVYFNPLTGERRTLIE